MVAKQLGLVYGGGTVGLMGELARTVQDGLGPQAVLGVIPKALTPREISNELIGDTKVGVLVGMRGVSSSSSSSSSRGRNVRTTGSF